MNKIMMTVGAFGMLGFLSACGEVVEIPSGHVGKLSTESGLSEEVLAPSKFRLEGFCITCDNLILAEASDFPIKESMNLWMPKDRLNLSFDVRGTVSVSNNDSIMNRIFDRIPAQPTGDERITLIPMSQIYNTYAQPIIRETARSVLSKYTISQVMDNRDAIGQELAQTVSERLASTPVSVSYFGLADIQLPEVVVQAEVARKEREVAIQRAEADKQVRLTEAEAALEVAVKQQEVDLKEAETQVLVNQRLAEGVNQAFVTQRMIKVLEQLANSDNKVFVIPDEALQNPAIMMGVTNNTLKN